jgi:rod shape-determining protein MreC
MEYSPPPLFKQGASARAKVVFFSLLALALLLADSRLRSLTVIRQVVGTVLYPLQMAALLPRDAANAAGNYLTSLSTLQNENKRLKQQQTINAETLQQSQQLYAENAQLRKLLGATERLPLKSLMSEILYDARDAFTRKIVLNRGSDSGVALGQPVIDDLGVVGQVTRVFPFTSEVTLLTDKDQAIPVQVVRSGLRSVAYGRGQSGGLELRFMATNADIQKGDLLTTSGIDGVYPAGLAVAKVVQVETKSSATFARIVCQPAAGIDRNKQLLILLTDTRLPPRPDDENKDKKDKFAKRHNREAVKEVPKEPPKEAVKEPVKEIPKELPKEPAKNLPKPAEIAK